MVKRYDPAIGFLHMTATMVCDNHGDWVDYLDYSKLHDANAKLTAELKSVTQDNERLSERLTAQTSDYYTRGAELEMCKGDRTELVSDLDACQKTGSLTAVKLSDTQAKLEAAEREVRILRQYGNKDCTAMADEALTQEGDTDEQN